MRHTVPPLRLAAGLLLGLAACSGSGSWSYVVSGDDVAGSSWSDEGGRFHFTRRQDGEELRVRARGRVDFGDDGREVRLLEPGASFDVRESGWGGVRELDATRAASGSTDYRYRVDGAEADFDDTGRLWLAGVVTELQHRTTLGAEERARRILAARGTTGLLEEFALLSSAAAAKIYFDVLLDAGEPTASELSRAVQLAGERVSSSSTLGDILRQAAGRHVEDEDLSAAILAASATISSSSGRSEVLQAILRERLLGAANAQALFAAAGKIPSSSSHGAVLAVALATEGLPPASLPSWVASLRRISSTSTREELLIDFFAVAPNDAALLTEALAAVAELSSSARQGACLRAFLARADLDVAMLRAAERTIDAVPSTSTREELRSLLLDRMLAGK